MSKAKKVIFVIVEGPTDEDALSSVLKQIFSFKYSTLNREHQVRLGGRTC